ncbi:hypothetical protein EX30DRAFT_30466 [Ascodesmis nigricans]|uniref:CENP-V/GFA domain-containing protein n=1 Tax=Ascodesmis nigricans TaxID=341454 RepID=A0A4S2N8L7_9PEZI|nr:hypothetical protein EX30DRAFT_30466 [Ascodesmis nigricans]
MPQLPTPYPHRLSGQTLTGSCHCTQLHYTITIPSHPPADFPTIDFDHCTSCRLTSGGLVMCWLIIRLEWLTFTSHPGVGVLDMVSSGGNSNEETKAPMRGYKSSPDVTRGFCGNCGASLTFYRDGREWVDVSVAGLGKEVVQWLGGPDVQSWVGDSVGWVHGMAREGFGTDGERGWRVREFERGGEDSEIVCKDH